jgi:hypothetical protein
MEQTPFDLKKPESKKKSIFTICLSYFAQWVFGIFFLLGLCFLVSVAIIFKLPIWAFQLFTRSEDEKNKSTMK